MGLDSQVTKNIYYHSEVFINSNSEDKAVELRFSTSSKNINSVLIDKPTAARLINQLRRTLDDDWNRQINERQE